MRAHLTRNARTLTMMATFKHPTSLRRLLFFSSQLMIWTAFLAINPILPIYVRDLGFSITDLGLISAGLGIALMIFEPIWGILINRAGAKRIFILSVFASVFISFSYTLIRDFSGLIFLRFIQGAFGSGGGVSSRTLVRQLVPKGGRAFGTWYTILAGGGLIGPVVGGYAATISYDLAFYLSTAIATIAFFLSFAIPGSEKTQAPSEEGGIRNISKTEKITILTTSTLIILPMFLRFVYETFVPVFAKESTKLLLNPLEIALAFTIMGVVGLFASLLLGDLSDKVGRIKIIILGMGLQALSFLLLPMTAGVVMLYLTAVIIGVGNAAVNPAMMALLTDKLCPSNHGFAIGVYGAGEDIGILLAPLIAGYFYQNHSAELSFLLAAVFMLVNIIVSIPLLKRIER
jgi:MFS family permease